MPPPSVNIVPSARPGTLQASFDNNNNNTQDSGSHMSQTSGPLFPENRLSISSASDQEICDQEIRNITRTHTPLETSTLMMSPRPGSSATVDYSTKGDPAQPAYSPLSGWAHEQQLILNTHNYLLPDSSGRRIYDIPASQHQSFMLGNGHAAYQIKLENMEAILETNTFLMDRLTGQFHAVYEDGYRQMATTPMLLHLWQSRQLIAKLDETQQQFGLPSKADASAASQCLPKSVNQRSQSHTQDAADDEAVPDIMDEPAQPKAIVYLEASFSLERPVCRLKMDKRLEVHNNYIYAVSNRMHKIDLINRLKKSCLMPKKQSPEYPLRLTS